MARVSKTYVTIVFYPNQGSVYLKELIMYYSVSIRKMMKFIERVILYLFPLMSLKRTKWEKIWLQQEREEFVSAIRIFFAIAAAVYALHYFTVDRYEGLAPSQLWMTYRFGMTGLSLLCLLFYFSPRFIQTRFYKLPVIIACALYCYFQTETIIWYPKVPYLYSFAFVLISTMVLRVSIFSSLMYSAALLALIAPVLIESGQSTAMMFSASVVTMIFIVFLKAKSVSELKLFISNQMNLDAQKKIIEINMEFTNQIKSFLPNEISKRLIYFVQEQRMSVIQAVDEVLRPRQTKIACLFSDVRGFTKSSGDLKGFVSKALLPNVKATTVAVERFGGISRKVGDLIFAYFDSENFDQNIKSAIQAAVEISSVNMEMNEKQPENMRIKRYILVSGGEAIVGNLSGYDSTIEITAIGSPVNCLSRVDELTKTPALRGFLTEGDILFTPNILEVVKRCFPGVSVSIVSVSAMNIQVRDFPEITELYLLPLTKRNFQIINEHNALGAA